MIKYHRPGSLRQQKFMVSQFWRPELLISSGSSEGESFGVSPGFWWLPANLGIAGLVIHNSNLPPSSHDFLCVSVSVSPSLIRICHWIWNPPQSRMISSQSPYLHYIYREPYYKWGHIPGGYIFWGPQLNPLHPFTIVPHPPSHLKTHEPTEHSAVMHRSSCAPGVSIPLESQQIHMANAQQHTGWWKLCPPTTFCKASGVYR